MKKGGKVLLTVLSAAALVVTSVIGTIAYFTDSENVVNTFTVGRVELSLDETIVDTNGRPSVIGQRAPEGNQYHLIPGQEYTKDPIVHVSSNSENCYVYVTVKNAISEIEWNDGGDYKTIADQMKQNGWSELKNDGANVFEDGMQVWVYAGEEIIDNVLPKDATDKDLEVFNKFKIDGDGVVGSNSSEAGTSGKKIIDNYKTEGNSENVVSVTAYAVQADGFETALAAWKATYGK